MIFYSGLQSLQKSYCNFRMPIAFQVDRAAVSEGILYHWKKCSYIVSVVEFLACVDPRDSNPDLITQSVVGLFKPAQ